MLCPLCRRMVGKDGYCPEGHAVGPQAQQYDPYAYRAPAPAVQAAAPSVPAPSAVTATAVDSLQAPPVPGAPALPSGPPQRPRKALAIGLSLVLAAVGAIGWVAFGPGGNAGAANLKRVFTSGESNTYSLSISMRGTYPLIGFALDTSFDMQVEERTLSVDKDGVARVRYAVSGIHATANGQSVTMPDDARISFTVRTAPDGRILENDEEGTLEKLSDVNPLVGMFGPDALSPLFPDKKVAPGATWTIDQTAGWPLSNQTFTMTLNNTLLEQKSLRGEDVSVIRSDMRMPVDLRTKFVDLIKAIEQETGESFDVPIPGDAGFAINGFVTGTVTQTVSARTGILTAAIGDMSIRGTLGFFGPPGAPPDMVFNVDVDVTMTRNDAEAI